MPKRLGPDEAVERMRAAGGAEPLEPYPGVDEPWRCRCLSCGTIGGAPRLSAVGPGPQSVQALRAVEGQRQDAD